MITSGRSSYRMRSSTLGRGLLLSSTCRSHSALELHFRDANAASLPVKRFFGFNLVNGKATVSGLGNEPDFPIRFSVCSVVNHSKFMPGGYVVDCRERSDNGDRFCPGDLAPASSVMPGRPPQCRLKGQQRIDTVSCRKRSVETQTTVNARHGISAFDGYVGGPRC